MISAIADLGDGFCAKNALAPGNAALFERHGRPSRIPRFSTRDGVTAAIKEIGP